MRGDLLLKLADLVERKVAEGVGFDLNRWASRTLYADNLEQITKSLFDNECGTTACMLGLAAFSGEFEGLRMCIRYHSGTLVPQYEYGAIGFTAAANLFAIKREEARWLFGPEAYTRIGEPTVGPEAATAGVRRIREFVARGGLPEDHWWLQ